MDASSGEARVDVLLAKRLIVSRPKEAKEVTLCDSAKALAFLDKVTKALTVKGAEWRKE